MKLQIKNTVLFEEDEALGIEQIAVSEYGVLSVNNCKTGIKITVHGSVNIDTDNIIQSVFGILSRLNLGFFVEFQLTEIGDLSVFKNAVITVPFNNNFNFEVLVEDE